MTGPDVPIDRQVPEPPSSLLMRVRAQDQQAWERLVSLYSPVVYRWCRGGGVQPGDVADVGQEVFRAVARKIHDFRRDRAGDTFRGWVRTITRHKVVDYLRARQGEAVAAGGSDALEQMRQVPAAADSSDDPSDADDELLIYRRAVDLLRADFAEPTWQAFWRVVVEGQRPAEVAEALHMTVNAVYLARARVLRRLREEFIGLIEL